MACIKARGQPSTVMLVSCGGLWSYGRFDLARVHWEVGPPPLWSERLDGRATHLLRALLPRLVSRQAVRVRGRSGPREGVTLPFDVWLGASSGADGRTGPTAVQGMMVMSSSLGILYPDVLIGVEWHVCIHIG